MKTMIVLLSSLFFALGNVYANPSHFDIYGVSPELQEKIFSLCKEDIHNFVRLSQDIKLPGPLDKRMIKRHNIELAMIKKVNSLGDFSVVKLSTINYPEDQAVYTTLDIVQRSDTHRLPKPPSQVDKKLAKKSDELKDLFTLWSKYSEHMILLVSQNKLDTKLRSCPVMHCIGGFDKAELKNELPKFRAGALKYKNELINIIKYSHDDEERGDAIFLLAHLDGYQEVASLMINLMNDASTIVRNNSMRVLGAILEKHEIHGLDIHNVLLALNYPDVTDRNKAAYVLTGIVLRDKTVHPLVIKEAGNTLMSLLKLEQPNNHDIAYRILKEISQQNYSDHDYKHWQQWIDKRIALR